MKKYFIFCHGFGYNKNFWKPLLPFFTNEKCLVLDLGYYGNHSLLTSDIRNKKLIGIGHSLGLLKLLQLSINFEYLIGLNSFINFLGNDTQLALTRKTELQRLTKHFLVSPLKTLYNFHKRCGVPIKKNILTTFNFYTLYEDLTLLSSLSTIPYNQKGLIIGSQNDPIVPPQLIYDNFKIYPNMTIKIIPSGGHGLGFLYPQRIYQYIKDVLM
ncbi:hypothetical protein K9U34_00705 [Lawsonia intracellularis]|uniref:AB hydrolase-1 domain-containing protein n=1 Tax=Lawsonia intracellularis (strain PHE/MN1-00) TaxID=363253 RepID=Q1MR99_LAWIP|nr:hypothetical protein [Lawsonia intracellularis]AGC49839.1 hypothetical protein LAW_00438 [Lawsonia intracellularis N343]KAA0205343.1 hypothetical protein C4K43_02440 [Lawsonia intracellularis]MBZ3892123.1 hypothetical protein [Lawsonia intracellularis]OMQ04605.1 hypothetical protein BW722_02280 [Lawsonia intracellularis]RBN32110.1 hypothetical protein DR194_03935 [Lawsonia intracellularis]